MNIPENPETEQDLQNTIAGLETRLADLQARLPAHSIPPALIEELDDIEEQLQTTTARLAKLRDSLA